MPFERLCVLSAIAAYHLATSQLRSATEYGRSGLQRVLEGSCTFLSLRFFQRCLQLTTVQAEFSIDCEDSQSTDTSRTRLFGSQALRAFGMKQLANGGEFGRQYFENIIDAHDTDKTADIVDDKPSVETDHLA